MLKCIHFFNETESESESSNNVSCSEAIKFINTTASNNNVSDAKIIQLFIAIESEYSSNALKAKETQFLDMNEFSYGNNDLCAKVTESKSNNNALKTEVT